MCQALRFGYTASHTALIGNTTPSFYNEETEAWRDACTCERNLAFSKACAVPGSSFASIAQEVTCDWTLTLTREVGRSGILVVRTTCLVQ